jgi:hypothetical protein
VRKNSFGLIVHRMGDGDAIQAARIGHGGKKFIAHSSRCVFNIRVVQARFAAHIGAFGFKRQIEFLRKGLHEMFVFIRFGSPQLMIEMQNMNRDSKRLSQTRKNPEHRHRIRSPGDTNANATSRPDHYVPGDGFEHSLLQVFGHPKNWECALLQFARLAPRPSGGNVSKEARNFTIGAGHFLGGAS